MVLSIKTAACASYYWQAWGPAEKPATAEGVWLRAPKGLGVAKGRVTQEELDRLLRRKTAQACETPTFSLKDGISGYDFVFSAPKSVSLLWALAPSWRKVVEKAHEHAVGQAAELLADRAIRERVGKGGKRLENADGALAAFFHFRCRPAQHAAFGENTDRPMVFPDPNLHTHVLAPDIVLSRGAPDQQRLKIAYTALYKRWSMALGAWYHATLAYELRIAGLEIEPAGGNGLFQLKLFRREVLAAFSARTSGARGLGRNEGFVTALAKTRRAPLSIGWEELEANWRDLARRYQIEAIEEHSPPPARSRQAEPSPTFLSEVLSELVESDAVLQEPDFCRGIASALVTRGAAQEPSFAMVEAMMKIDEIVELDPTASYRLRQWTSRSNFRNEQKVVGLAQRLDASRFPSAVHGLARSEGNCVWTDRQWAAAQFLAGEKRLAVLTGAPGTGKTSIVGPVVSAYKRELRGMRIFAAAEAWQTALNLGSSCDIECFALAQLFVKERHGRIKFDDKCVLIVDEGGLLATDRMLQLLRLAERTGLKLIILGDSAQLNPIGAGSGMELLKEAIAPVHLDEVVRQTVKAQRDLVEVLVGIERETVERFKGAADAKGVLAPLANFLGGSEIWTSWLNSKEAVSEVARLFLAAQNVAEPVSTIALARSHREAHQITRAVRTGLRAAGQLPAEDVVLAAVTPMGAPYKLRLCEGDRIRFLFRDVAMGVVNGTRGVIREIVERNGGHALVVDIAGSRVPHSIKFASAACMDESGRVRLACDYAATIFGCQGATYDRVIVLRSKMMAFRELYVALTRARESVSIIDVDPDRARWREAKNSRAIIHSMLAELTTTKRRDRVKSLALRHYLRPTENFQHDREPWLWDSLVRAESPLTCPHESGPP